MKQSCYHREFGWTSFSGSWSLCFSGCSFDDAVSAFGSELAYLALLV